MLESLDKSSLKQLNKEQVKELAEEMRGVIIDTVSKNGGHLASNLGIVEASIAIHRVFDIPEDTVVFDVGHQAYAHKLLTGRYDRFSTLRKYGGISGFTNKDESPCDFMTAGHSGSALSVALGKAEANRLENNDRYVIAVIGDGSFTNGMTFEAIDACSACDGIKLIILLNDNEMSISKNVGGLSKHFSRVRSSRNYYDFKRGTERFLGKIPLIGRGLAFLLKKIKDIFKRFVVGNTIFDSLGINFLGTVDGNNEERLEEVLAEAKRRKTCCIIHMTTKKGMGYEPAEKRPDRYHGVSAFDVVEGAKTGSHNFSGKFGKHMIKLAGENDKICAVTAAMRDGTGLGEFSVEYPDRFFDVGIAEEHGAAFSAGLALGGRIPVYAIYSTFAQRIFDQMVHDVSLQRAHVVFAIDRSGIVPDDGVTHHGVFDVSMMSCVPGLTVYSPDSYDELRKCIDSAVAAEGPVAVRYPKGKETDYQRSVFTGDDIQYTTAEKKEISIITYGIITDEVLKAAQSVGDNVKVIKLLKILPVDTDKLKELTDGSEKIFVIEEGMKNGGIGEIIASEIPNVKIKAIEGFVSHGDKKSLYRELGLDAEGIAEFIKQA